jgi:hypothetical protein
MGIGRIGAVATLNAYTANICQYDMLSTPSPIAATYSAVPQTMTYAAMSAASIASGRGRMSIARLWRSLELVHTP